MAYDYDGELYNMAYYRRQSEIARDVERARQRNWWLTEGQFLEKRKKEEEKKRRRGWGYDD